MNTIALLLLSVVIVNVYSDEIKTNKTVEDQMGNCSLKLLDDDIRNAIKAGVADSSIDAIKFNITINGANENLKKPALTSLLNLDQWMLSLSISGKSILMLKDEFEELSLGTLGFSVKKFKVELEQHPINCVETGNISLFVIEQYLRLQILHNFEENGNVPKETTAVCNRHIEEPEPGVGVLASVCCHGTSKAPLACSKLERNIWITMLFTIIIFLQVWFVLYSPLYLSRLSETVFKTDRKYIEYRYESELNNPMKLNVLKLNSQSIPTQWKDKFEKTQTQQVTNMASFKSFLKEMDYGEVCRFDVKEVKMMVAQSKICPEGYYPVTIISFIKDFIFKCGLRHDIESVGECCSENMFKSLPCNVTFYWHTCLKFIMDIVLLLLFALPWVLRVLFYYAHEHDMISYQKRVMAERNLNIKWRGSLVSYLSPTSAHFVSMYIFLVVEVIFYMAFPAVFKRKLKFTITKCFNDMIETSLTEACGYFASQILWPMKRFGVLGCVLFPFWLLLFPFVIIAWAVQVVPIINVSLRLLVNLFYYIMQFVYPFFPAFLSKRQCSFPRLQKFLRAIIVVDELEENVRGNKIIHAFALIMSFISIWMTLILASECILFYVECVVYILIGVILNIGSTIKYVSLVILIGFYGHDTFTSVGQTYAAFHKTLHTEIKNLGVDKMKTSAKDENTAFVVSPKSEETRMRLVADSKGFLKWHKPRLLLFLDKMDIPYIPKHFVFKFAKFSYFACPGPAHLLYLKAIFDFAVILLFLTFVFIVILAFGQANSFSSGTQAMAAMAGGFLPLVFRKFLFKSHSGPSLDTSKLRWQYLFEEALETCCPRWYFADIILDDSKNNDSILKMETSEKPNLKDANYLSSETEMSTLPTEKDKEIDNINGKVSEQDIELFVHDRKTDKPDAMEMSILSSKEACKDNQLITKSSVHETLPYPQEDIPSHEKADSIIDIHTADDSMPGVHDRISPVIQEDISSDETSQIDIIVTCSGKDTCKFFVPKTIQQERKMSVFSLTVDG